MVIFVILRSAHLVRYYEPTLRTLAGRGHLIHIGYPFRLRGGDYFDRWVEENSPILPGEAADEGVKIAAGVELLSNMASDYPNISWGYLRQKRSDGWGDMLTAVRLCRDYLRFFDDSFQDADVLRERAIANGVPQYFQRLMRSRVLSSARGRQVVRLFLTLCHRAIPVSGVAIDEILDLAPDLVLVARLVDFGSMQDDYVYAAHHLGIPIGLPVASWDNLTNKGVIRVAPDFVTVWNEFQKREAVELHGLPEAKVRVTGAQPFDMWFDRRPSVDRATFCGRFGFDPDQALIAYLASSNTIAGYEVDTVRRWLRALRAQDDPLLRNANVIVRPHPFHADQWKGVDLSAFGGVELWPRAGALPLSDQQRDDFYDTVFHAGAIVGLNTSAQVEAAIMGRPILVLINPEEDASRKGTVETLHFRYLSDAEHGIATVADSVAEHFAQLCQALRQPAGERARRFVKEFLRPHGLDRPAAPILADAFEDAARTIRKRPEARTTPLLFAVRMLLLALRPVVAALQRREARQVRQMKDEMRSNLFRRSREGRAA